MSVLHVSARTRTRLVPVLVGALVTALAVFGLGPVPAANAADPVLSFVGANSSSGNRTTHPVTLPAGVQAGDTMVLFLTVSTLTGTLTGPAGWTLLQSTDGAATRGRAWTKQAVAGDAGTTVTVTGSAQLKDMMSVSVYRSTGGTSSVTASAGAAGTTTNTSHTTPAVAVSQPGSWLVSSWSEKSTTDPNPWTAPAGTTTRAAPASTGGGKVSGLLGDSGGPVATGTAVGRTATTATASGGEQLFSVVVGPGTGTVTPPTNVAPVASFTATCSGLTCNFNASASSDANNDPLTYAWNFGDGSTGAGVTAAKTYATAAARTVTLTVSDGILSNSTTRTATTTTTPAGPRLPVPNHTKLVPETAHTDMPKIANGEITDIKIVGTRVFIAGSFTSIQNQRPSGTAATTTYTRTGLASYSLTTGLVDTGFNPRFTGGVDTIAFTPDNTKLFVTGSFSAINGITKRGIASLNLTTGAPLSTFTATLSARGSEVVATNSTLYIGGRFTTVNSIARVGLAAVSTSTGALDTGFVNNLSGGLGVDGALTVQRLLITHDQSKLIVIHTGRQVAGQNRTGVAMISIASKQLLPWRSTLWDDNLQFVGGIQRAIGGAVSPDDSYFVVTSGSGGDRPPINDTVVAFDVDPTGDASNVQPKWITRCFDSVYSVAISEKAIYIGGHFAWNESPTAPDPWPGLDDVGYGTGQGLSGYGLGDAVVNREHLGALNPVDGHALEWNPGSNSYEGNKAMEVTPRGLFTGGDATTQAGVNIGRIAFFDFNSVAASNGIETAITEPIEGRVNPAGEAFTVKGTASVTTGTINRVELRVYDREANRYLADNLTTWQTASNTINTTLQSTGARTANWSLPLTIVGNHKLALRAQTFSSAGTGDNTPANKKTETFGLSDQPPNTSVTGPSGSQVKTMTFTVTGSATDDVGVKSIGFTVRDASNRYLQPDWTVASSQYTFRFDPDVVGAKSTTWSKEITVPTEGTWRLQARSIDSANQSDLDTADGTWIVSEDGVAPSVAISAPVNMLPPTAVQPVVVAPGSPITFSGSATDDQSLASIEISLRNNTTRENLASDGTWGVDAIQDWHPVSNPNLNSNSANWTYTTNFPVKAGSYSFAVRATDKLGLTTSSTNQGKLTVNAQVAGDAPPDGKLTVTGTTTGGQSLHLNLTGTATDDKGVKSVLVSLYDGDTSKYLQPNGTLGAAFATRTAVLGTPNGTSTTFTLPVDLPQGGDWNVTAFAYDTVDQQDTSTSGATARYRIYPGDLAPTLTEALLAPTEGASFTDGRIFVSGRAEDDKAMQNVQVSIMNSANQYMSSSGTFTSTTASWRTAFLTSPGTPGSNFSYTTPVVPPGAYTVSIRGTDNHDQVTTVPPVRHVTVSHPAGNTAPVAKFTYTCPPAQTTSTTNVCEFDGRTSTDENAPTLTYAWTYTRGTTVNTSSGPKPIRTFTVAGAYTVQLIVTDEWGLASPAVTQTVTIATPATNHAPTALINPPSCSALVCNISGIGSADQDLGDTFTYAWDFADGTTSTSSAVSHTFPAAGTYLVKLTVTDGWGASSAVATRSITVTSP
jgi:large repetitive protein